VPFESQGAMTLQQMVILTLQASIIVTVFGLGLRAAVHDLHYLLQRPSLLARSLLAMLVIMPIVALAIAALLDLRPSVAIALGALAISPVAPLQPGREQKAGGEGRYAVGLMALAALLAIVTVPASAWLLGLITGHPYRMPLSAIAGLMLKLMLLPLAAGIAVRRLAPAFAERSHRPLTLLASLLLVLGSLAILASAFPAMSRLIGGGTLLAMAVFVVIGIAIGDWLGGPRPEDSTVLAISTVGRHPATALMLAKVNFPNEPFLVGTLLLYLMVEMALTEIYTRRRHLFVARTKRAA
jgi:BASS family bile acid:Na+ symporter